MLSLPSALPLRLVALGALLGGACVSRTPFHCATSAECDVGAGGACEPEGYCSIQDLACGSGRRFAEDAPGDLAGQCTGGTLPDAGGPDGALPDAALGDGGIPDAGGPDAEPDLDYTPSNFGADRLSAGSGTLTVQASDGVVEIDSVTGSVTRLGDGADLRPAGAVFSTVTQSGLPSIGVLALGAVEIEDGATVRIKGSAAFALAVHTDVHVAGTIDLRGGTGSTFTAGPGGFAGGKSGAPTGLGACAGASVEAMGDIGGGGAGHVAAGGTGGARGTAPVVAGGAAGGVCGVATLIPLVGGSGGGAGGGTTTRGQGGGGGGALQISARGEVVVTASGVINAGGGGGGGGGNEAGGGGGGAGGAVLLEGRSVRIAGVLAANGGGGGAGADMTAAGESGQPGGANASGALGGVGTGEGKNGGPGGAGAIATAAGSPGTDALGITGSDNAGGGGGGAGRLHLRGASIMTTGVLSPAAGLTQESLP